MTEWISVRDRLPETGVGVLVIVSGHPTACIELRDAYELAVLTEEGWILEMWPEAESLSVTYWTPLPELPEPNAETEK